MGDFWTDNDPGPGADRINPDGSGGYGDQGIGGYGSDGNWYDFGMKMPDGVAPEGLGAKAGGAPAGGAASGLTSMSTLLDPFTAQFSFGEFNPGPVNYQTFSPTAFKTPGNFVAPTAEEAANEPGYQFALDESLKALQGNAAANGSLLTGGTLKSLLNYARDAGQQNYQNVFNRKLATQQNAYGQAYQPWAAENQFGAQAATINNAAASQARESALSNWMTNYNRALQAYGLARENFYNNQDRPFNKLSSLLNLGESAAAGTNNAAGNYGANAGNTITNQQAGEYGTQGANAAAAGLMGGANAWANAAGNIGQTAGDMATLYSLYKSPRRARVAGDDNFS